MTSHSTKRRTIVEYDVIASKVNTTYIVLLPTQHSSMNMTKGWMPPNTCTIYYMRTELGANKGDDPRFRRL